MPLLLYTGSPSAWVFDLLIAKLIRIRAYLLEQDLNVPVSTISVAGAEGAVLCGILVTGAGHITELSAGLVTCDRGTQQIVYSCHLRWSEGEGAGADRRQGDDAGGATRTC